MANILNLIHAGVDQVNTVASKRGTESYRRLVNVKSSTQGYEEYRLLSGFGDPTVVGNGQPIPSDSTKSVFSFRIPQIKFAKKFDWTFEDDKFDVYSQYKAAKLSGDLAKVFRRFKNKQAANLLNNGFSGSTSPYTIYDGQNLFSASHTGAPGATPIAAHTWSNVSTAALGTLTLEAAIQALYAQADPNGQPMEFESNAKLIVPLALQPLATRLVDSDKFPMTNDNDPNYSGRRLEVDVQRYLTSTTAWFLRNSASDEHGLIMIQSQPLELKRFYDGNTASNYMTALELFAFGIEQWPGCWGSTGA